MAYHKNRKPGAQINRTPAPDEITNIRKPGMFSPGTNGPQPSAINPGQASESLLAQNLRQSQVADTEEDVLSEIIRSGTAGRGDDRPEKDDAFRTISAAPYPAAHGMVRQQNPSILSTGKPALPSGQTSNQTDPIRKP
jgi:hypothetical protein